MDDLGASPNRAQFFVRRKLQIFTMGGTVAQVVHPNFFRLGDTDLQLLNNLKRITIDYKRKLGTRGKNKHFS